MYNMYLSTYPAAKRGVLTSFVYIYIWHPSAHKEFMCHKHRNNDHYWSGHIAVGLNNGQCATRVKGKRKKKKSSP